MFDTTDQILRQLRAGEDSRAEFKELRFGERGVISPNTEDFASKMVAFANGGGGALFLGVDDAGSVVGVPGEKWGQVEQWVLNVATHNCDPPIRPEIRRDTLSSPESEEASVIIVVIPRGLFVHSQYVRRALLRTLRIHQAPSHGAGTRPAVPGAWAGIRVRRATGLLRDSGEPGLEPPRSVLRPLREDPLA